MNIFITGGSGFIGTNLIEYYLQKGVDVCNYDIAEPRNKLHQHLWRKGDICDLESLESAIEKFNPEFIIHLAARTDLDGSTIDDYPANIQGVENIIDALQVAPSLKRVLFASSRLVCKIGYQPANEQDYCPTTAYGESKVIGEKIVRDRAEDIPCAWMLFRPTSIWGPWFDVPYKDFFMMIMNGRYVHPLGKRIRKSFGFVGNSVYMIDKFVGCDERLIHKKTLYLTDYPELEVQAWANLIAKELENKSPKEVPYAILKFAAILGDSAKALGWKNPPLTSFRLNNLLTEMLHDTKEVAQICGELPYSLRQGVKETVQWINRE